MRTLLKDRDVAVPVSRRRLVTLSNRPPFSLRQSAFSNAFASLGSKIENAANVEEAGQLLERYLDLP